VLGVGLEGMISNQITKLLEKKIAENKNEVEKLILLEGGSSYSYVQESSYWDELCRATQNKDTLNNARISVMPIVALTANASSDTQNKLMNNGFSNYMSKPFNPDNLFKILKKYFHET
jgi:DNA-binding NtrC family response regulator